MHNAEQSVFDGETDKRPRAAADAKRRIGHDLYAGSGPQLSGRQKQQADFINIVAWRHTAEFAEKYFTKGQLVAVEGSIQTRSYQDKDGNSRTAFEVVADQVYFAEKKNAGAAQNTDFIPPPFEEPAKGSSFSVGDLGDFEEFDADDSDLPF